MGVFAPPPYPEGPTEVYLRSLCFIFHGDRVLLIFQPDESGGGWWNGLGGKVERGEDPLEAAQREIFEEAGIHASLEFRGVATAIVRSTGKYWSMFLFSASVDTPALVPSVEGPLQWAAPDEIGALPVFPDIPYLLPHLRNPSGGVLLAKFVYATRDPGTLEVSSIRVSAYRHG